MSLKDLEKLVGLSESRLRSVRESYGNPFEHEVGNKTFVYAPDWLARHREEAAKGEAKPRDDYTERINRAKALKAEHELRVALSEVMTFEEARQEVQALCDDIRGSLDQCCHPCQQKIRSAIEGADNPPESVNGHSDSNPKPAKRKRSVSRPSA